MPLQHKNYDQLSSFQTSVLIGSLLGDLSMRKRSEKSNAYFSIIRSQKDLEYLKWEAIAFNNFITPVGIRTYDKFDKRTSKIYETCAFESKSLPIFNPFYQEWYPNGKKIVPLSLELDPVSIAVWFCDDGHIYKNTGRGLRIELSTDGFTETEVIFLQDKLEKRYNNKVFIIKTSLNQFKLRLFNYIVRPLIEDIRNVFPEGMERKRILFDTPQAEHSYSYTLSSQEKHEKIKEFLAINSSFVFSELSEYVGFYSIHPITNIKRYSTNNIMKYLQPIIDLGHLTYIKLPNKKHQFFLTDKGKEHYQK